MIDIGELQKQGRIVSVSDNVNLDTDKDGFYEVKETEKKPESRESMVDSRLNERIQELDKTVYRLEQRIELLERKLGIDNGTPPTINW